MSETEPNQTQTPEPKPWKDKCSHGCYHAKTGKKKCKCRCHGKLHGKAHEREDESLERV